LLRRTAPRNDNNGLLRRLRLLAAAAGLAAAEADFPAAVAAAEAVAAGKIDN